MDSTCIRSTQCGSEYRDWVPAGGTGRTKTDAKAIDEKYTRRSESEITMNNEEKQEVLGTIMAARDFITEMCFILKRLSKLINGGDGGREISLTITKVQEAEYWLAEAADILPESLILTQEEVK